MKRSEMVDIIYKILRGYNDEDSKERSLMISKDILKGIEEAGMEPPEYYVGGPDDFFPPGEGWEDGHNS